MEDAQYELEPDRGGEDGVESDEVADVEDSKGLHGGMLVLGFHCLPVDAEEEEEHAHGTLGCHQDQPRQKRHILIIQIILQK